MPVKNGALRLARAIKSVAQQGWPHELIVVDGMSEDATPDIISEHSREIAVSIRAPDASATEAVNRGAARATGEFIGLIMSDDWLEPDALAHIGAGFQSEPSMDVVSGGVRVVDERSPDRRPDELIPGAELSLELERILGTPYPAAFFFRRAIWDSLGGLSPAYRYGSDRDFLMRCKLSGAAHTSIPQTVYNYSVNPGSDTLVVKPEVVAAFLVDHYTMADSWLGSPGLNVAERRRLRAWRRDQIMELAALRAQSRAWGEAFRLLVERSLRDPAQVAAGASWFAQRRWKAPSLRRLGPSRPN